MPAYLLVTEAVVTSITVGTWGKSLAVRVPQEIARATGLVEGEQIDIEIHDGDIVLRRSSAQAEARHRAKAALERMVELSNAVSLEGLSIRDLIDEGRR
nr:AbrB/MazE/SpoVT family DNA-binding domain-containing protein [uncultured Caulobacter sp.]